MTFSDDKPRVLRYNEDNTTGPRVGGDDDIQVIPTPEELDGVAHRSGHEPVPHWRLVLDRVLMFRAEQGEITYNQLVGEELDDVEVGQLMVTFTEIATAANAAKKAIGDELARRIGSASIQVGDVVIRFSKSKSQRIEDPDGFWAFMLTNPDLIPKAFNPNQIRKTGIPASVFDTFYRDSWTATPSLSLRPADMIKEET